jgi:membrane-associated phospholipid phosphatase
MQTTQRQSAEGPAPTDQPPAEAQRHRRGLIHGHELIGLGIGVLALFGLVTAAVLFLDPLALDVPITREVQDLTFPPAGLLFTAVSAPGFQPWNFIFPLAIILGLALLRRIAEAAFLGLAAIVSGSDEIVKALVHRARPSADLVHVVKNLPSYSFPSGHVTEYTLVFGFCFYLVFALMRPGLPRTALLAFCGAMGLLVGPSRIWLGQHWASDVLGGYTLGFGLLLLVIWGYRRWERRHLTQPTTQ